DARVPVPARLQDRELRAAVDVEVGERIPHAVEMAHLPGEVEEVVLALDQVVHGRAVADIGDVDGDAIPAVVDVEGVAAVVGVHGVNDGHVSTRAHQPAGEVAADEAEAPRDEDLAAAEPLRDVHAGRVTFRSTISSHQSRPSSRATWNTRWKLKNCERP